MRSVTPAVAVRLPREVLLPTIEYLLIDLIYNGRLQLYDYRRIMQDVYRHRSPADRL
jgi:hypothetical protein